MMNSGWFGSDAMVWRPTYLGIRKKRWKMLFVACHRVRLENDRNHPVRICDTLLSAIPYLSTTTIVPIAVLAAASVRAVPHTTTSSYRFLSLNVQRQYKRGWHEMEINIHHVSDTFFVTESAVMRWDKKAGRGQRWMTLHTSLFPACNHGVLPVVWQEWMNRRAPNACISVFPSPAWTTPPYRYYCQQPCVRRKRK